MKVKVILNPYANRWGAKKRIPEVLAALDATGLIYELVVTAVPGQGVEEAEAAANEFDAVVAAGGDSTVNEVVNGLIRAAADGPTRPLGVLPLGTGNDFNDMNSLPRDLNAAAQIIHSGHSRQIDAGRANDHYFANNCAIFMEPLVTLESIKIRRLSGNLRYIVALFRALRKLKAWQMQLTWDEGVIESPAYLLSVCNSARTGGVFRMAPGAATDDGLLDFVFIPEVSKRQVLALLPRLFNGSHVQQPKVVHERSRCLEIECRPGTPMHTDGEIVSRAATKIEYQVLPGKITLLAPNRSTIPGTASAS
jgi:diacylglycerol kinase (ATP)